MRSPSLQTMSDAELKAYLEVPRMCTQCRRIFLTADFPITTMRGRLTVRSWCRECLRRYYREHSAVKRAKDKRAAVQGE